MTSKRIKRASKQAKQLRPWVVLLLVVILAVLGYDTDVTDHVECADLPGQTLITADNACDMSPVNGLDRETVTPTAMTGFAFD